ncbi:MAG TPA: folylpolyglutamate synthase/dihydrofolate synthase family protein [Candidatus Eisenbacteria bacterium]|nr:folylpolyglutamate synthase/dihydrofolate synthase family protein [Candidatus Eisenbacteria bacterium]
MKVTEGASLTKRLDELYRFERSAMRPGLAGVERLLARAGRPDLAFPSILIAGTNGKGSTAAHLDSILRAAGLKTGLYTSPHLVRFGERIRVGGSEISEPELEELLTAWWPRFEAEHPSFFEAATALCFDHFARSGIDLAVVEVGLGGRLDATNILEPRVAIITTIANDHADILGPTLRRIAEEKAGILKRGGRLVLGVRAGEPRDVILAAALERGIPVTLLGKDGGYGSTRLTPEGTEFHLRTRTVRARVRTPLLGRHQARNGALAALAAEIALQGMPDASIARAIDSGLRSTRWPARAEILPGDPPILIDVAHNLEGAMALVETVQALWPARPIAVVAGFSRDKEHEAILATLARVGSRFYLTPFEGERAAPMERVLEAARAAGIPFDSAPDVAVALALAKAWAKERKGAVLLAGSVYLAGAAMPALALEVPHAL